jgi:hypothetical protein
MLLAAATLIVMASTFLPSAGAASTKRVGVNITPHDVAGGATQTFAVTFANKATRAHAGSADLTAPRSFTVLSASTPQGTATVSGGTVELRGLDIPPGGSLVVNVVAVLPCLQKTTTWSVSVMESDDFSEGPFDIAATSDLHTTISGDCSLVFLKQPHDAAANDTITSADVEPSAGPVKVAFYDGHGNTINGSSADITLAIASNPSGGTLNGTTTVTAVDGVAIFDDLSIDAEGLGYTLHASAPGFTGTTSDNFDIVGDGAVCTGPSCSATTSDDATSINVTTHGVGVVEVSLSVEGLDCADYTEVTAVITFSSTTDAKKRITAVISPPLARPKSQGRFEVCYSSTTAFKDKFGNLVTTGLLPPCHAARPTPPCVVSSIYGDRTVTVTFLAPAGDPKGRL